MSSTLITPEREDRAVEGEPGSVQARRPDPRKMGSASGLRRLISALGTVPYFLFVGLFLVVPVVVTIAKAFTSQAGGFTLEHFVQLTEPQYVVTFVNTFNISWVTSVIGAVLGLVLAWALVNATKPVWLHKAVTSLAAVASQLGGPPLAYAFIAFIGAQGLLTVFLRNLFDFNLNEVIPIGSFWGIACAYLYFQIPLMAILSVPALQGIRKEWVDGGLSLGASRLQIFVRVTLPILSPSLVGGFLLLFANAFSSYAVSYAMAGSSANLVPILIGFFLTGNVLINQGLASALITGMIAVMVVAMALRTIVLRRATKWSK